jgi:hypothetical protein
MKSQLQKHCLTVIRISNTGLITDLLKEENLQEVSSPLHWQITVFEWDADESSREDKK